MSTRLSIVDIHSHLHDLTRIGPVLKTAHANFAQTARAQGLGDDWDACLFCADLQGKSRDAVMQAIDEVDLDGVTIARTQEPFSRLITVAGSGNRLFLVMGYQIICSGDIEVLAYGLNQPVDNGLSMSDTLTQTLDQGALAVLPWGFGKWWFKRGKLIDSTLHHIQQSPAEQGRVFVGDNGGRVFWSRVPALINKARSLKIWNLAGSDPLPFADQAAKAGGTGSVLPVDVDAEKPLSSLQRALGKLNEQPVTYGSGEPLLSFILAQVRMQMVKRLPRRV